MSTPPEIAPTTTLRLTSADFDAYVRERAGSAASARPRLELRQRLLRWARGVVARLGELGIAVEVTASDGKSARVDSQRVFFCRDEPARKEVDRIADRQRSLAAALHALPHEGHAFLALTVDGERVEVSIEMSAGAVIDVKNLRARLADPGRTLELTSALESLPEQFVVGLSRDKSAPTGAPMSPVAASDAAVLSALLDQSEHDDAPLWIGWSVPRDLAVKHSALLDEQLEDAIVALGPVYKLIAWSPDNDLLLAERPTWEGRRAGDKRASARDRTARTQAKERREPRVRSRADDEAFDGHKRARGRDSKRTPQAPPVSARSPSASQSAGKSSHPTKRGARPEARPILRSAIKSRSNAALTAHAAARSAALGLARAGARTTRLKSGERSSHGQSLSRGGPVTEGDSGAPVERGTRVRVLAGPFVGKVGLVQELDGKGGARVMLGLLATRLDVKDLVASAEGRDRPALASSHRRPLPAR